MVTIASGRKALKVSSLAEYRENWPRVGAVGAMALAGASVLLGRKKLTDLRALSVMNALALAVHQYEEYEDPGYFAGQANAGMLRSKQPRNYPLNRQWSLCINTALAYPFYLAPIVFPKTRWVGLPPILFGFFQAVDHGIVLPRLAGARYSPGFLSSSMLHVPIGVAYIRALRLDGPISRDDWRNSSIVTGLFFAALLVPLFGYLDKNSPYAFSAKHLGPYDPDLLGKTDDESA